MADISSAIGRARGAAKAALGRARKVNNMQMDEDLQLFERLKPQDLDGLAEIYGHDAVITYVKAMTAKKVSQNGPG